MARLGIGVGELAWKIRVASAYPWLNEGFSEVRVVGASNRDHIRDLILPTDPNFLFILQY